ATLRITCPGRGIRGRYSRWSVWLSRQASRFERGRPEPRPGRPAPDLTISSALMASTLALYNPISRPQEGVDDFQVACIRDYPHHARLRVGPNRAAGKIYGLRAQSLVLPETVHAGDANVLIAAR